MEFRIFRIIIYIIIILNKLVKDLKVRLTKKGKFVKFDDNSQKIGVFAANRRGFGFVIVDGEGTIYTPGYSYLAHTATTIWGGTGAPASTALVTGTAQPVDPTGIDTTSDGTIVLYVE